jgi:hypothetical protein
MATAEEKWKRQQLLVAEKIGEDPAAGRGEIKMPNPNQLRGRRKQEPDCTQNIAHI